MATREELRRRERPRWLERKAPVRKAKVTKLRLDLQQRHQETSMDWELGPPRY